MRGFQAFLILAVLALTLGACASSPMLGPTATPVPLAETASPPPLATRIPRTPVPTNEKIAAPSETAPAPLATPEFIPLDNALVLRTTEGFLSRLVKGEFSSAANLFLTDEAKQGQTAQTLLEIAAGERLLTGAEIVELRRVTTASFEGQALLHWADSTGSGTITQTGILRLAYRRGLWLIDDLMLGELQAPAPAPTRSSTTGSVPAGERPSASPLTGTLVFQVSSGGGIHSIEADGAGLRRLTDGIDPAWSPDGTRIALSRWREPRGVWIVSLDGSEQRLFDWSETRSPLWSPDGTKLVFSRKIGGRQEEVERCFWRWCFTLPPKPHWKLAIVRLDDGALIEPPSAEVSLAPAWSPDGRRIVYHDEQGLAWLDVASDEPSSGRFGSSRAWDTSPTYSPDGTRIVFMSRVHDRWEILVMNADASGRRQLTETYSQDGEPRHSVAPAWSPDGEYIAFLSNRDGPWRLYVMQADGSGQRSMFGNQLDSLGLQYDFASERVLSWTQ